MRESRASSAVRRLDVPGLITSAVSLFALTYALIEGNVRGWTSPLILAAFALAAVALAAFLAIESRSAHPMVELTMFRSREFSGGTGTMMIWAFGILGIYFFTSLYLQETLGFSPVKAGLAFVPMALCVALFAAIAPPVQARAGAHRTVASGMLLMVVGLVLFARLGLHAGYASLLPGFMLFGAGAGLMNVPLTNAVMAATPTARAGIASALLNASREVAGLLGITVIGAVLSTRRAAALRSGADPVHAFLDGYHTGLLVTIALMAAGVLVSYLTLRPRAGVSSSRPAGITAAGEIEAIGESLGELIPEEFTAPSPHPSASPTGAATRPRIPDPAPGMPARIRGWRGHDNRRHHRQRHDRRHGGPAQRGGRVSRRAEQLPRPGDPGRTGGRTRPARGRRHGGAGR